MKLIKKNNFKYIFLISITIFIILILFNITNILLYTTNIEKFNNNNNYFLPKIIFGYWDNLNENKMIQANINNWKKKIPKDWKIIILNKYTVKKYVSAYFIERYSKLNATRFADFLRLDLLKNYGGVWMDAGIFITNAQFLDNYRNEMLEHKYDICLYELKYRTIDPKIPYLENWFIMAPKNSLLIRDLYKEFDKSFEMGFIEYKKKVLIPSGVLLQNTIQYNDKETYLMQHAIINNFFHMGRKYNINIKSAEESMFKIHDDQNWNDANIIKFILNNNNWNDFYAVKLVKSNRRKIYDANKYIDKINSL
jgi:hypothetical protein